MAIKKSINEYEIAVKGKQNGAPIPINYRLVIADGSYSGNAADDGYDLWMEIRTYQDSNHTTLLFNDMIPINNLTLPLGATLPTKLLEKVTATEFEKWMDAKIGVGKWKKIK